MKNTDNINICDAKTTVICSEWIITFNVWQRYLWKVTLMVTYHSPPKAEGYRFGDVRPAVRPSVRMSRCPSVTNVLGLYLKDNYRFEHETSGVYIPHWGEVHCTRTITLHCLNLELLSFVIFHTCILCGSYLGVYKIYQHEAL